MLTIRPSIPCPSSNSDLLCIYWAYTQDLRSIHHQQFQWMGRDGSTNVSTSRFEHQAPAPLGQPLPAPSKISTTRQTYSRLVPDAGAQLWLLSSLGPHNVLETKKTRNKWFLNGLETDLQTQSSITIPQAQNAPFRAGSCHLRVAPSHWRLGAEAVLIFFLGRPLGAIFVFFSLSGNGKWSSLPPEALPVPRHQAAASLS